MGLTPTSVVFPTLSQKFLKRSFCLISLLLLVNLTSLKAQSIQIQGGEDSLSFHIEHLFAPLDTAPITTGVLLDKSLDFIGYENFRIGATNLDTADINSFGQMYARLSSSWHLNGNTYLPDPKDAYCAEATSMINNDTIPIVILADKFNVFKEYALSAQLIDFTNNQLHDVVGRSESPYLEDSIFMASPLINNTSNKILTFVVKSDQVFSRLGSLQYLEIDFGDGQGLVTVYPDIPLTITYPSSGMKLMSITGFFSGGISGAGLSTLFILDTDEEIQRVPDFVETLNADGTQAGFVLEFFLKCPEAGLRKPLVIINGYDPPQKEKLGITRTADIMFFFLSKVPGLSANPAATMEEWITNNDFDLVWLTYKDGGAPLVNLSLGVKEAIKKINELKAANGSRHQNVIAGVSHGGVVGKFALLDMEELGIDHETDVFINFDEGNRGANVSLAAQHMLKHLLNMVIRGKPLKDYIPLATEIEDIFKARALKDLIEFSAWGVNEIISQTKPIFFENLLSKGINNDSRLFHCTYLTIANGSLIGIRQQNSDGSQKNPGSALLDFNASVNSGLFGRIELDLTLNNLPNEPVTPTLLYKGKFAHKILWGAITTWSSEKEVKVTDTKPLDTAPGGNMGFTSNEAETFLQPLSTIIGSGLPIPIGPFCITPAVSSVDLRDPEFQNLQFDMSDIPNVISNGITRTHAYIGPVDDSHNGKHNLMHPSLTAQNMPFFLSWSLTDIQMETPNFTSGRIYNLGTSRTPFNMTNFDLQPRRTLNGVYESITLSNNSEIWFNRQGKIGFQDVNANGQNVTNTSRDYFISLDECTSSSAPEVRIEGGSNMIIGQSNVNNFAHVNVERGSKVIIGDEGEMLVEDNSSLTVFRESKVIIEDGGFAHFVWGSKAILEEGSEFIVKDGATLRLSQYAQLIVKNGASLIIEPGATIQLWDGDNSHGNAAILIDGEIQILGDFIFSGNGHFVFQEKHSLVISQQTWTFLGDGREFRNITIESSEFKVPANKVVFFKECIIECVSDGSIVVPESASLRTDEIDFESIDSKFAIQAIYPKRLTLNNTDFSGFSTIAIEVSGYDFIPGFLSFTDCQFEDNLYPLIVYDASSLMLSRCQFHGNGLSQMGIALSNVREASLRDVLIEDCLTGLDVGDSKYVRLSRCTIEHNQIGVYSFGGSNFFLYDDTRINENTIGMDIFGEENWDNGYLVSSGLVHFDCARLTGNEIGITGIDVLLSIDGPTHAHARGSGVIKPNTFINGTNSGDLLFDIELIDRNIPLILARNNYWGMSNPVGNIAYSITKNSNQVPITLSPFETSLPGACPSDGGGVIVLPEPETIKGEFSSSGLWSPAGEWGCLCQDTTQTSHYVNGFFQYGYQSFLADSIEYAESYMDYMATAQTGVDSTGWPDYCGFLQSVAIIFLPDQSTQFKAFDANLIVPYINSRNTNDVFIYPNPGQNEINIASAQWDIKRITFYDISGKIYKDIELPGEGIQDHHTLVVSDWLPGIYLVKARTTSGEILLNKWIKN